MTAPFSFFIWEKVACGAFSGPSASFAAAKSAVFAACRDP
jgi:hypothetical protein